MIKYLRLFTMGLALVVTLTTFSAFAQEQKAPVVFRIETKDGNGYTGEVVSRDSIRLVFKAEKLGQIEIRQSDIKTMVPIDPSHLKEGKYWFRNPQSTRYFFSPNGYGLKKGEGYYQNIWVLMNSFAVGVNDYVSIGGGLIPLFLFAGSPTPAWITAKVSIPVVKDQFNLGAGILAGNALGASNSGFGIFYGIATAGSRDRNISLGIGYGFAGGAISTHDQLWRNVPHWCSQLSTYRRLSLYQRVRKHLACDAWWQTDYSWCRTGLWFGYSHNKWNGRFFCRPLARHNNSVRKREIIST